MQTASKTAARTALMHRALRRRHPQASLDLSGPSGIVESKVRKSCLFGVTMQFDEVFQLQLHLEKFNLAQLTYIEKTSRSSLQPRLSLRSAKPFVEISAILRCNCLASAFCILNFMATLFNIFVIVEIPWRGVCSWWLRSKLGGDVV